MPTYQYACTACDERLEAVQSFTDAPLTECPACSGRLRKVFSAVGVVFKGSGFYKTDSRSGSAKADAKGESTGTSDSKADGKNGNASPAGGADKKPAPANAGSTSSGPSGASGSSSGSTGSSSGSSTPVSKTA